MDEAVSILEEGDLHLKDWKPFREYIVHPIFDAIANRSIDMVCFMLYNGVPVDFLSTVDSVTPLHAAICNDDFEMVRTLLVDYNANPYILDRGKTCLEVAKELYGLGGSMWRYNGNVDDQAYDEMDSILSILEEYEKEYEKEPICE